MLPKPNLELYDHLKYIAIHNKNCILEWIARPTFAQVGLSERKLI